MATALQVRNVLYDFVRNPKAKLRAEFEDDCIPVAKAVKFTQFVVEHIWNHV